MRLLKQEAAPATPIISRSDICLRACKVDCDNNTGCSRPEWTENAWTRRRGARTGCCVDRDGREWWSSRESDVIGGWFCDWKCRRFRARNHAAYGRLDSIVDTTSGIFFRRFCETDASVLRGRRSSRDCGSHGVNLRRGRSVQSFVRDEKARRVCATLAKD